MNARAHTETWIRGLRGMLAPLAGDDRRMTLLLVAGSLVAGLLLILTGGKPLASLAFIAVSATVVLTFYRIEWGFYIFVGLVLAFDQFIPAEFFDSVTIVGLEYFQNLKSLPFLANVAFAVITPMELHLLFIIVMWLILIALKKEVTLVRVPVAMPMILFFLWVIFAFVNGMRLGGDFLPALWEIRALFYLGIMCAFVPQIIQKKKHIRALLWVCIPAITFKALQGIVRFVSVGFTLEGYEVLTNHEDPLFFISLFILLLGFTTLGGGGRQATVIRWLMVPLTAGFIVAQRRAAFGSLVVSLVTLLLLLPRRQQLSFLKGFAPAAAVFLIYLAVFWGSNSTSAVAKPAIFIRSAFYTTEKEAAESYSSNLFREMENYDLAYTIRHDPVTGIGFGRKYFQPIVLPKIPFPLMEYIPHNAILWLVAKTGSVGFFLFCFFLTSFVFQAATVFSRLKDPYLKSVCIVAIVGVLGQVVVSYFDLQLTFYRNMVYLGVLMGLLPVLELADEEPAEPERVRGPIVMQSPL